MTSFKVNGLMLIDKRNRHTYGHHQYIVVYAIWQKWKQVKYSPLSLVKPCCDAKLFKAWL